MARPTVVRGVDTRDAVVAAAWELARRDGIATLSLRDLAAAVGIKAPSLYHHFDGKDAIYDAMFRQGHTAVNELVRDLDLPEDPREALVVACRAWLDFCRADWPRYQLMYTRIIPDWEPSAEAYAVAVEGFDQMHAQLVALGMGDTDVDLLVAVTAGLAAQQFANDPDGDRWIGLARRAVEMIHDQVLGGSTPALANPRGRP